MSEVITAIIALSAISAGLMKWQQKMLDKNESIRDKATKETLELAKQMSIETKEELRMCQLERKEERKEWLEALEGNTTQLKSVADKLDVIPSLQKDVDNIKDDIEYIKEVLK